MTMTPIRRGLGTYEVVFHARARSRKAAEHVATRFGRVSRNRGTMTDYDCDISQQGPHDYFLTITYKHTCRNHGNAQSDATRFLQRSLTGTTYRVDIIGPVRVRPWKQIEPGR